MLKQFFTITLIFFSFFIKAQLTISGTITDVESGEQLLFVSIYDEETGIGTVSNEYGFFSLTIPLDSAIINIEFLGYAIKKIKVDKSNFKELDFSLEKEINRIKVVEISFKRTPQEEIHNSTQMSAIKVPLKDIRNIPSIGGETDIIKVIQLMPGVQKGGEGGTGMYVRGGDVDQNLVILDEATVYNIGHLFGFFSVFNQDAIKDMTLYKGAFPSKYGGRLSSVLDIKMNEGNNNKFHSKGGIGLLSSRLMIEAPLKKNKGSFMIAGRRTYIDQVFKWIGSFLPYYFYDLNAKFNYKIDNKNHLFFSSYIGNDVLDFDQSDVKEESLLDFGFTLGNVTSALRWNRIISDKTFANYSAFYTNFDYNINGKVEDNSLRISSAINDYGAKVDYEYFKSKNHTYRYGGIAVYHQFNPNVINTQGEIEELLESNKGDALETFETGAYIEDIYIPDSSKWEFRTGLRLSSVIIRDKVFGGLEPRLAVKYALNDNSNLKLSYSNMRQYMHLVSSSTVALPTDLWYPVTKDVKPQISHQIAGGYSYFFKKIKTLFSAEVYYKYMANLTEYREGTNLLLNSNFEEDLLQGNGDSYGLELLVKKDEGRWNGWVGYTLSWSNRYFDELNGGEQFSAKYDRRHNLSIVQNLKISDNWSVGAVWVFSTGSKFTPQIGLYAIPDASSTGIEWIPQYAKRNSVSMSATHRLDLNFVWKSSDKKKFKGEWHFGGYNVYKRASPMRVEVVSDDNGGFKYVQPGLFGFVPSIAYNFEF